MAHSSHVSTTTGTRQAQRLQASTTATGKPNGYGGNATHLYGHDSSWRSEQFDPHRTALAHGVSWHRPTCLREAHLA